MKKIMLGTEKLSNRFFFSILIFQTAFLAFYPYFSFHDILSSLVCLSILLLALGVSVCSNSFSIGYSRILIYAGLCSVGLFRSNLSVLQESQGILFFTQIAFFQACAVLLQSPTRQRFFFSVFFSALTVVAFYGLWQAFFGFQQGADFYAAHPETIPQSFKNDSILLDIFSAKLNNPRIYSVFTNPNILGSFLLCGVPAFFWIFQKFFFEKQKNQGSVLLLILLAIPFTALFFTESRSAKLLLLFCFLWMVFAKTAQQKFWDLTFLTLIAVTSVFYLQPWKENLPSSFQSRLNYWENTWQIIREFPVIGSGWGSFPFEFLKRLESGFEVTRFAHNHWLQMASELGIPAALCLMGWVFWLLSSDTIIKLQALPAPETSVEKSTSMRCLIYPALLLATVFTFFPPFTILLWESSYWVPVTIALLFLGLAFLFFHSFVKNKLPFLQISSAVAVLLFLSSLVELSLDTLALSVFFFGFLGAGTPALHMQTVSRIEFYRRKIFQGILLLGIFFTVSHIFGGLILNRLKIILQQGKIENAAEFLNRTAPFFPFNKDIAFQESFLRLQAALLKNSEDIHAALDQYWKMAERFPKDYLLWMTLAKLAHSYPENVLLQKRGMLALEQALLWAPANKRLHLLKAQLLVQNGNHSQSIIILKPLLSDSHSKNWDYMFSLNDTEKRDAQSLLDSLS